MGATGQTYVVRIYRREPKSNRPAAGVVVFVDTGEQRRFTTLDELLEALVSRPHETAD